jgi:hypothetical protein
MLAAVVSTQPGAAILTDADHAGLERTKLRLKIGSLRPAPFRSSKASKRKRPGTRAKLPAPTSTLPGRELKPPRQDLVVHLREWLAPAWPRTVRQLSKMIQHTEGGDCPKAEIDAKAFVSIHRELGRWQIRPRVVRARRPENLERFCPHGPNSVRADYRGENSFRLRHSKRKKLVEPSSTWSSWRSGNFRNSAVFMASLSSFHVGRRPLESA